MNNLLKLLTDNSILIIPNELKENILNYIRNNNKELNIKIFSLNDFIKNITFDYDEKVIDYVSKKYDINYNISKLYLDNVKYIKNDSDNEKLHNLYMIKNDVDNLLIRDKLFNKLINNKKIIIYGYDYINKYNMSILNTLNNITIINKDYNNYIHDVYHFKTLEDEVIYAAEKISELLNKGIDINNIFISNLDDNYRIVIKRIFNMYNIPINLNNKKSIFETNIGKWFINNLNNNINIVLNNLKNEFNLENEYNNEVYKKIINVINKFYFAEDYLSVKDNIIEVMKNTFIKNTKYINAINEINIINNDIYDDKYVFLFNFNLNKYPIIIKDEDYINDDIKPDIMEKSYELNAINKEIYYKSICNIKNLFISFKEEYLSERFYPSLLIDEYNLNIIDINFEYSKYSNGINKILLAKDIDKFIKYNDYNNRMSILYNNYEIPYNTYNNIFSGINKNSLYEFLDNELTLSYSSMDNYYKCAFKFYLANILKIDKYEDTIQAYIGNLFHYVLSKAFLNEFNFDETVNEYLNTHKFEDNYKNKYFINKVLNELKTVIDTIKYQNSLGNMNEVFYEKEISIEKKNNLDITFKGFIDKILKKDNYIVIVDYKTYMIDIKLNYLPYGLSMQLPVYLYLTKNIDKNYEIIGLYLQQILFNKFNKDNNKSLSEQIKNNLKLKGYSLGNEEKISIFDKTLNDSEIIHGMKLTNKGFGYYSKVLTEKQINNIYKITDDKINECINNIENAIFDINPKKIDDKNIGCEYCKFKDICYVKNEDIKELKNIKDLSFLSDEVN